ncbi:MAG: NAD(P)/FAD-dependent oxidoreductase [Candidatus Thorarchaeota archaeon]|nr:MAG: hypothetical protein DRP09_09410 [Candidatus Thorarchaeota archaeon]RLI57698.1 MAG: hypothetical protein DRO87_06775 [Candidatus Thorarchaeota archaeon]
MKKYDVIVVGGGPGGSATAIGCASAGMDVLLIEKGPKNREKPCGGVLPLVAPETIEDIVGDTIPDDVREEPSELGLYYVPPSGRANGGRVRNYKIHNVNRGLFDQWLRDLSEDSGVDVRHETTLTSVKTTVDHQATIRTGTESFSVTSTFLVGADGVRSLVRRILFPDLKAPPMIVEQEHWRAEADIEDCFYGFFRGDVSDSYAYLIPKADSVIIGLGVVPHSVPNVVERIDRFRQWLVQDFEFIGRERIKREMWSIPFGYFVPGRERVLLVGDAAGLCNPLSGEGIRLAVESGEAASNAIIQSDYTDDPLPRYVRNISGLAGMIEELNRFVRSLDDDGREEFVRNEIERGRT